jgi:hypothetical protein
MREGAEVAAELLQVPSGFEAMKAALSEELDLLLIMAEG